MENKPEKVQKPKYFLVLKIIGFPLLIAGIALVAVAMANFGNFDNNLFMLNMLGFPLTMAGIVCLIMGFRPEMAKLSAKSARYIQQETKQDMTTMAQTNADINKGAVQTTVKAVKEGLKEEEFKYCTQCGEKITKKANFCSSCGQKQE